MIDVTDEMVEAYARASDPFGDPDEQAKARIAAVLAIAERQQEPYGTKLCPRCGVEVECEVAEQRAEVEGADAPCCGCGHPKAWHGARCAGDFLSCPCETWMPLDDAS